MSKVIGVMKCKDSSVPDFMVTTMRLVDDNEGYVGIKDDGEEYHVYCQYWDFEPVAVGEWKYPKGSEKDFEGAPEWVRFVITGGEFVNKWLLESFEKGSQRHVRHDTHYMVYEDLRLDKADYFIIAHREPITECTFQDGVVFDAPIGMPINEFKCRQQSLNASDSDANINGIPLNKITAADVEVVKYDPTKADGEQLVKCGELKIDGEMHDATINKYIRDCKGVQVDVYDVLQAFDVTNPALQHLIKKALCVGIRGHKTKQQDLQDIIDSAIRAKELEQ